MKHHTHTDRHTDRHTHTDTRGKERERRRGRRREDANDFYYSWKKDLPLCSCLDETTRVFPLLRLYVALHVVFLHVVSHALSVVSVCLSLPLSRSFGRLGRFDPYSDTSFLTAGRQMERRIAASRKLREGEGEKKKKKEGMTD
jgi:hypothetical protein